MAPTVGVDEESVVGIHEELMQTTIIFLFNVLFLLLLLL